MVGGADQGPCFHVTETQGKRVFAQIRKLSRRVVTVHRKMIPRRLEVLAQRQYVNVELLEAMNDLRDDDVDMLTLGQFPQHTRDQFPVDGYHTPRVGSDLLE